LIDGSFETADRLWRLGYRWRRPAIFLGPVGSSRLRRPHPPRARSRHQLDQHRAHLRLGHPEQLIGRPWRLPRPSPTSLPIAPCADSGPLDLQL